MTTEEKPKARAISDKPIARGKKEIPPKVKSVET